MDDIKIQPALLGADKIFALPPLLYGSCVHWIDSLHVQTASLLEILCSEGSGEPDEEILRCAQDDMYDLQMSIRDGQWLTSKDSRQRSQHGMPLLAHGGERAANATYFITYALIFIADFRRNSFAVSVFFLAAHWCFVWTSNGKLFDDSSLEAVKQEVLPLILAAFSDIGLLV